MLTNLNLIIMLFERLKKLKDYKKEFKIKFQRKIYE